MEYRRTAIRALLIGAIGATTALAGCNENSKRIRFEGQYFRAKATAPREDRHNFTATAGPLNRGVEGARQAAFYEGTLHCIKHYGTSEIDWVVHPTEDPVSALTIDGDRVVVQGRCLEWPKPGGV